MRARDFDRDELDAMPTLAVGQADDLKIDNGDGIRVWVSRVDGSISVERFDPAEGRWETVDESAPDPRWDD